MPRLLRELPFDGIHLDQYGEPQTGDDAEGQPIDVPFALRAAIEQLRTAVPHGEPFCSISCTTGRWKNAPVDLDFLYCEMWPPIDSRRYWPRGGTNPRGVGWSMPVIAVYIDPDHEATVAFAHGGDDGQRRVAHCPR